MRNNKRVVFKLMLAVAGVCFTGAVTDAQQAVNTGNVRDANNRIGAGGYNNSTGNRGQFTGLSANDIVTGNVTGGKAFRGTVPYTDPRAFRGPTSSDVYISSTRRGLDSFLGSSSGPGYGGNGGLNSNALQTRAFYGEGRGVAPPAGFAQQQGTGGYVPAPMDTRTSGDIRLGSALDSNVVYTPRPGELVLPGPVTNQNNNSLITASSLYGVRQWDPSQTADQQFLQDYTSLYTNTFNRQPLADEQVRRLQQELSPPSLTPEAMGTGTLGTGTNQPNAGTISTGTQGINSEQNLARPLPTAPETPQDSSIAANTLGGNLEGTGSLSNSLDTGQSFTQNVITTVPQQQRTSQYSALQDRIKQYYAGNRAISDAEAARRFNEEVRALRQRQAQANAKQNARNQELINQANANRPNQPGQPQNEANNANQTGTLNANAEKNQQNAIPGPTGLVGKNRPKPEQVPTLKGLVKPKGLAEIMQTAEDLMRQGKFISALDQYDAAQQIAPNYAVTTLGRANAELGASYYTRSEIDLRQAFTQDPSLLEGQFDLRGMLGEDRLSFLVKDLKEIVNREKTKPGPVFLLAYIMYNTGNERLAAGYLDLAEKRAGANDTFYRVVRAHWTLPDTENPAAAPESTAPPTTAPSELNK